MCMKGTTEGCVLLERMTKVETKQNFILLTVIAMFAGTLLGLVIHRRPRTRTCRP